MNSLEHERFERLARQIEAGSTLVRAWEPRGGVSASVTALEVRRPDGRTVRMIVRQHGGADLARNPDIAADEYRLLQALHRSGLPVPSPYYVSRPGEIFPIPCIVMEYIDGQVEIAPGSIDQAVRQMATSLARIHNLDVARLDLSFLPRREELCAATLARRPAVPDDALSEGRIRATLDSAWPLSQLNPPALLHGDFWPGNLLWRDGQLVGIVDWEDAALGDPLADLANSRLEILWALGPEAMREFTRQYMALTPALNFRHLACWDLFAALRPASKLPEWGLDERTERMMRERHHQFVTQALDRLSG